MELKSAKPKSRLRYLRLLFFIPAISALVVMAYCIWQNVFRGDSLAKKAKMLDVHRV